MYIRAEHNGSLIRRRQISISIQRHCIPPLWGPFRTYPRILWSLKPTPHEVKDYASSFLTLAIARMLLYGMLLLSVGFDALITVVLQAMGSSKILGAVILVLIVSLAHAQPGGSIACKEGWICCRGCRTMCPTQLDSCYQSCRLERPCMIPVAPWWFMISIYFSFISQYTRNRNVRKPFSTFFAHLVDTVLELSLCVKGLNVTPESVGNVGYLGNLFYWSHLILVDFKPCLRGK